MKRRTGEAKDCEKNGKAAGAAALLSAVLFCRFMFCSASLHAAGEGHAGEIFTYGAGARPLAMGGAYTAVVKDAMSVYYNPSGLGLLARPNINFMHSSLFEGGAYESLGYANNFGKIPGGWGLQVLRLSVGDIAGRDENNSATSSFIYSETAFSLAAGIRGIYLSRLSAGAGLKVLNRSMPGSSDRLYGADVGVQYGPFFHEKLNLGLVIQNAVSLRTGDTSDTLPLSAKFGAAFAFSRDIQLVLDVDAGGAFRVGTEYTFGVGALRLGYDRSMLSVGGGVTLIKTYNLDIAVTKNRELGLSQKISLGYQFGKAGAVEKPKLFAKNYLDMALRELEEGSYLPAVTDFNRAVGLDPLAANDRQGEKMGKLAKLVKTLKLEEMPLKSGDLRQTETARRAIKAYLDGEDRKAVLLAHQALGENPQGAVFEELLQSLSGLTSIPVRRDEVLPKDQLVLEKLNKSSAAFYAQKFKEAADECEGALLIDEKSAEAWIKLGSDYYALGDTARARQAYEKALELNPNDQVTLGFMKLQGWR